LANPFVLIIRKKSSAFWLGLIIGLAAIIRVAFHLWIAPVYFGRTNIYVDGDTEAWAVAITNLIENGHYSSNLAHPYGYFARMPGYGFFLGIFYLISGKDWSLAYPMAAWIQTAIDVFAVYLIYLIGIRIFQRKREALILAGLYALYPFIVVWNPVCYAESLSVFLMLSGIYFFLAGRPWPGLLLSGVIIGIAALFRPQLIFLLLSTWGAIFAYSRRANPGFFKRAFWVGMGFTLAFAGWPLRNYLNHGKWIITQDLRGFYNWNEDVVSFMQYMHSIQTGWTPQFNQIMKGTEVTWPESAYLSAGDSAILNRVARLASFHSSGFSSWKGYERPFILPGDPKDSTQVLKNLLDDLRMRQVKDNPVGYWLIVPMKNLQKAIFKTDFNKSKNSLQKLASGLFLYRTLLILIGVMALTLFFLKSRTSISHAAPAMLFVLLFTVISYGAICFGTSPQFRNIEMRYFLPADILLLIPAAWLIASVTQRYFRADT